MIIFNSFISTSNELKEDTAVINTSDPVLFVLDY